MMTANPQLPTKGHTHHNNSGYLFPQDPTACRVPDLTTGDQMPAFHPHEHTRPKTSAQDTALGTYTNLKRGCTGARMLLRKEVIQPHLPLLLPFYDYLPLPCSILDLFSTQMS